MKINIGKLFNQAETNRIRNGYWKLYIGQHLTREGIFINDNRIGYWRHYTNIHTHPKTIEQKLCKIEYYII